MTLGPPSHQAFNHAPTRGATFADEPPELIVFEFQSTRPRGARRAAMADRAMAGGVSIHAPTRGATPPPRYCCAGSSSFNPRAHAGRDDARAGRRRRCAWGFNPRAHAGRDLLADDEGTLVLGVSIHAPTRGATARRSDAKRAAGVSIHAPTRGATSSQKRQVLPHLCFNPRAHAGRDRTAWRNRRNSHRGFNPRAHAGRDWGPTWGFDAKRSFQSTRPRGARPARGCRRRGSCCRFNPRAHAGRDQCCVV